MKRFQIFFFLVISFSGFSTSLYQLDEKSLNEEFKELNSIEEQVVESGFDDQKVIEILQHSNIQFESADPLLASGSNSDFYMDWGSFAWGFCCCPIGFFVVAVSDDADDDMKKSYWIGVLASAVLSAISSLSFSFTF